ncbi:hypothetical protein LTS12_027544 [Elasticomyces elasticus]|nr:hypothetical protein LTS12_027544 [Elasticomyces elasticus]
MDFVDKQPGGVEKSAASNKTTMPSRNFACITEIDSADGSDVSGAANGFAPSHPAKDGHSPLHKGEENAGSKHPAADGVSSSDMYGGLDVSIKVEIDPKNREGAAHGYGFSIPPLQANSQAGAARPSSGRARSLRPESERPNSDRPESGRPRTASP